MAPKKEPTLDDLHDATLESIHMDWEHGDVVLSLRKGSDSWPMLQMIASGASLVVCTRQAPWGQSVSVNSVTASRVETQRGTKQVVSMEMQSGDTITLEADFVRLQTGASLSQ
ncbi:MAG: hypothetical protein GC161_11770 [Planctomycetaceae bacterium]|nr:hypothetical protein [Planctomycetaceae bacterium]